MTIDAFVKLLLAEEAHEARVQLLRDYPHLLSDELAQQLKAAAIQQRLADVQHALAIANLIFEVASLTSQPQHKGYALWAEAVIRSLELGEYQFALERYDEAIGIFQAHGDEVSPAVMQLSRIWSLTNLGRHKEVFPIGESAASILQAHEMWVELAILRMNLASTYTRLGQYSQALLMYDQAQQAFEALSENMDDEIESLWAGVIHNRAICLCYLGRFEESLQASQTALAVQERLNNSVEGARVRQIRGVTYFMLGRYNEALNLLEEVRNLFVSSDLHRHSARLDLYICDCLLQMRRFEDALEKSQRALRLFTDIEALHEAGVANWYRSIACLGLAQYDEALQALNDARQMFLKEENEVWVAYTDLEGAAVLCHHGQLVEAEELALSCARQFELQKLEVKVAEAYLVAARAAAMLPDLEKALGHIRRARRIAEERDVPWLLYQARYLQGKVIKEQGNLAGAQSAFDKAIGALERLRGHLMIEFRVGFQEDKQVIYEDMVGLCLELSQPDAGFDYAERAKSRALLDLLSYRLNLRLEARSEGDGPIIEELLALRAERDQLYRQWEAEQVVIERGWAAPGVDAPRRQRVQELEKRIAGLWHKLLMMNAGEYTRESTMWQVRAEPVQPYLDDGSLLIEYFSIHDRLVVFLVDCESLQARYLTTNMSEIRSLIDRLNLNLRSVPLVPAHQIVALTTKAQILLQRLHQLLVAPILDRLQGIRKLRIVPHGLLHYLPLHALYDGRHYLLEQHEISFLPSASLLPHCRRPAPTYSGALAFGYSSEGQLPFAAQEAQAVAEILNGDSFVEENVKRSHLPQTRGCQVLHLAMHAECHEDEPLFSGLLFHDGWLTTLDIFNLDLNAALVTLSACQTGRHVIGGGDELLGLMRAFLYAGAHSLLLTLWPVADHSTPALMQSFYQNLANGRPKDVSLQQVQRCFIRRQTELDLPGPQDFSHPYFWAPFFLVGDVEPLTLS
jgi:CHAT domain-containing protein/tetratricopeptide (TPR) repeat protein